MNKKLAFLAVISFAMIFSVSAQETGGFEQCSVAEAQNAQVMENGTYESIERDEVLSGQDRVSVAEDGGLIFVCENGFREVEPGSEGMLEEVINQGVVSPEPVDANVSIEEALQNTEEIEENLDEVNQGIDETLPDRMKSLLFGDDINFQVDNTTIGIETNSSGITGVEEGGLENPDLEISMDEDTIQRIMESDNPGEEFTEAYTGEGIDVQAYSFRNKVIFGVVNTGTRVYGFVNSLF